MANDSGDLIDMQGELLTSLKNLELYLLKDKIFNEFNQDDKRKFNGILVKMIEKAEIIPEDREDREDPEDPEDPEEREDPEDREDQEDQEDREDPENPEDPEDELENDMNACEECGGHGGHGHHGGYVNTGCIDGYVNEEVPVIVQQPCYYDKPIPVPVYRKKQIPYNVICEEKVCIPKYEYVHIPVEVPIQVPFNVEVPCYKEVTKVCPQYQTRYQEVPRIINRERIEVCNVPKIVNIKVPCVQERCVEVPVPYKVVKKVPCY